MFLLGPRLFMCFKIRSYLLDLRLNMHLIFMSLGISKAKTSGAVLLQEHHSSAKRKMVLTHFC